MGDDSYHFPREREGCWRGDPVTCCAVCWVRLAVQSLWKFGHPNRSSSAGAIQPGRRQVAIVVGTLVLSLLTVGIVVL